MCCDSVLRRQISLVSFHVLATMITVKVVDSSINVQDLYNEVSYENIHPVSLFVVFRKQIPDNCMLWDQNNVCDPEKAKVLLSEACKTVQTRMSVDRIAIFCRLNVSYNEPCVAVACSASNYFQASGAVQNVMKLIYSLTQGGDQITIKTEITDSTESNDNRYDTAFSNLIQVRADNAEINHRINSFIERKREQINSENIRDFCSQRTESDDGNSCARVDAVLVHRKDNKGHLRIRKVYNSWGPQTRNINNTAMKGPGNNSCETSENDPKTYSECQPQSASLDTVSNSVSGVEERLRNIEEHIGFSQGPVPANVFVRLRKIEDRILYLEGLSPEYAQFWGEISKESSSDNTFKNTKKRTYSQADLANKIKDLQYKLMLKGN